MRQFVLFFHNCVQLKCLGFDVTVQIDLANIPDDWELLVKKIGLLKRNCFAAVFEKYFDFQVEYLLILIFIEVVTHRSRSTRCFINLKHSRELSY